MWCAVLCQTLEVAFKQKQRHCQFKLCFKVGMKAALTLLHTKRGNEQKMSLIWRSFVTKNVFYISFSIEMGGSEKNSVFWYCWLRLNLLYILTSILVPRTLNVEGNMFLNIFMCRKLKKGRKERKLRQHLIKKNVLWVCTQMLGLGAFRGKMHFILCCIFWIYNRLGSIGKSKY